MAAQFLMSVREALDRRSAYIRQLRAHRNASIAAYWNSEFAAAMKAGTKQRAAAKSATAASSKKFNLGPSQIGRARKEAEQKNVEYLMSATSLKHRLAELRPLARDAKYAQAVWSRISQSKFHFAAGIEAGHSPANAYAGAILATAYKRKEDPGTIRRTLSAFGIARPPKG